MARILVISPTPTHPQNAGNRARIFSLLSALRSAGHQIGVAFVEMEDGDLATMKATWDFFRVLPCRRPPGRQLKRWHDTLMKAFGIRRVMPFGIDDWFDISLLPLLDEIRNQFRPEVVLVEYAFLSKAFECFSESTLKLLDTHDVLADRHHRLIAAGIPPMWFYTTPRGEKKALDRADCILAIQPWEQASLSTLTQRPVITVGHLVPLDHDRQEADKVGSRLLFVGSANPLNVTAVQWFLDEVFPLIRLRCAGACLEIVGDCAGKIPDSDNLLRIGRVDDVKPYYRRAAVVVNPVRVGTGLKIKAIEALAMGCPMITTSAGCAGLESGARKAFRVADTATEFAEEVLAILLSESRQVAMSREALAFAREYNCQALQPLLACLGQWGRG